MTFRGFKSHRSYNPANNQAPGRKPDSKPDGKSTKTAAASSEPDSKPRKTSPLPNPGFSLPRFVGALDDLKSVSPAADRLASQLLVEKKNPADPGQLSSKPGPGASRKPPNPSTESSKETSNPGPSSASTPPAAAAARDIEMGDVDEIATAMTDRLPAFLEGWKQEPQCKKDALETNSNPSSPSSTDSWSFMATPAHSPSPSLVAKFEEMGFPLPMIQEALLKSNNDENVALDYLTGDSMDWSPDDASLSPPATKRPVTLPAPSGVGQSQRRRAPSPDSDIGNDKLSPRKKRVVFTRQGAVIGTEHRPSQLHGELGALAKSIADLKKPMSRDAAAGQADRDYAASLHRAASRPVRNIAQAQQKIAIVGAGVAGLLLAQGLKKVPGLSVTVFEQSDGLDDNLFEAPDWAVAIHDMRSTEESMRVLLPRDVFEQARKCWKPITSAGDQCPGLCKGRQLRKALTRGIDIAWDHRVIGAYPTGKLMELVAIYGVNRRKMQHYHLVIGADGRLSETRKILFGHTRQQHMATPYDTAYGLARITVPMDDLDKTSDPLRAVTTFGRNGGVCMTLHARPIIPSLDGGACMQACRIFVPTATIEYEDTAESLTSLYSAFAAHPGVVDEMIQDQDSEEYQDVVCRRLTVWVRPWENRDNMCTLIGDAAHELFPVGGLGFIHAVHDVRRLVHQLSEPQSHWGAIARFERELFARSRGALKYSGEWVEKLLASDKPPADLASRPSRLFG